MTIFYGCGGGGSDARVSNLKEVFNGSPSQFGQVTRELNFSIKSKKGENTPNDLLRLNYFGFGGRETKLIGEFDGIRIFEGSDLAKSQALKPGFHVRYWHDVSWRLTTVKCMCGEVLGIFEIDGGDGKPARRVSIDLFMTYAESGESIDWSTKRGFMTKKSQCAHSASDNYNFIHYDQPAISHDISLITDPVQKVSSLIPVVSSIGKIVMGSEVPQGVDRILNGRFVSLATENLEEFIRKDFIPGIIVVTNPW